jgi:hypothetical protein
VFAEVQASRFEPAGESVLKNISPTAQVDGVTVPVLIGRVVAEVEKSTFRPWFCRSTLVWPTDNPHEQTIKAAASEILVIINPIPPPPAELPSMSVCAVKSRNMLKGKQLFPKEASDRCDAKL